MEHLFDNKKLYEVTKSIMKKTGEDIKLKEESSKKVEEAVGVSNDERKAALAKAKTHTKGGAELSAHHSKLDSNRFKKDADRKTIEAKKGDSQGKDIRRGYAKAYNKSSVEKSNASSLMKNASKVVHKENYEIGEIIDHEEYGEGAILSFNDSELEVVFDHGVEVLEIEESYHPSIEFHVVSKDDSVKGKYGSIKRARNAKDKFDNSHGGYHHSIKYYHKDKKKYVDFSDTGPDSK